ncbi:TPD domain-containing protein [[Eubacterium] cellulosolvens]
MKLAEYRELVKQLNTQEDIEKVAARTKHSKDFLLVIYSQKMVRLVTKKYHKIKHLAPKYHDQWKDGKSFLEIAEKIKFSPVLTGLLILKEEGISRKLYRKYLNNIDSVDDERLKAELIEVMENDIIYSPKGNEIQARRGKKGEELLHKWLTKHDFKFRTEKEIANKLKKTPDFLLNEPINARGIDIHWIESKATFGTRLEIKKNLKNQLLPYRDLYGKGMVIYWFGFITPLPFVEGILIESGKFLKEWRE